MEGSWSIADLHYAASQQNGTTSVTLSPAPSLDGQAGSPTEHSSSNGNNHLSSSSSSTGSAGNHSDDSEYDSVGESPERSPVNQSLSAPSPPPPQQVPLSTTSNSGSSGSGNGSYSIPQCPTPKSFSSQGSKMSSNNTEGGEYNNSKLNF